MCIRDRPYTGRHAFPGGHLDYNEDLQDCCLRELREETGLNGTSCTLFGVRGHPLRDPRGHYVTIIYVVRVPDDAQPTAGDDAATAKFYDLETAYKMGKDAFAFDHFEILDELVKNISKYI
eukprot:TRINITY_DN1531_c0_g1_i8.p2 TRINITY_DN1531_c0_g1~~TRINITY_DN1531_c0_g1_i8.p2  ORF type:complete len:142 (-),score=41.60 TRINITY_DN1531_c0_g1_i8:132-494(-)